MTISAKIVADSISNGIRITTYELEFPRFLLPQFNTHRLFSRNAASSRAIPVKKQIELIKDNPAMPIHWGKNQPGMSADEECDEPVATPSPWTEGKTGSRKYWVIDGLHREEAWLAARDRAVEVAEAFAEAGYHKQIVNRILEPFAHIKVVCTATEYDNFFWLRRHKDAQPEIKELADRMWEARGVSTPVPLKKGDWHVPYFQDGFLKYDYESDYRERDLRDAIAISASCCAQVSYRRTDDSIEKAHRIYERLVESKPVHASPFEHQATPMKNSAMGHLKPGYTHQDVYGNNWSANFRGWIQNRQLIGDHTCWHYEEAT